MKKQESNNLHYYQFDTFDWPWLTHAIFSRHGGVSGGHWASLNMSISVGDSRANVAENRTRAFQVMGRAPDSVADVWQVHSAEVVVAEQPRDLSVDAPKADILITNNPEVTLFQRFADCVPILLVDPKQRALGLVHAGWRGTLLRAAGVAARAMQARYGSNPQDIRAGIGPSISPQKYEVGPEVIGQTRAAFGTAWPKLLLEVNGRTHLDLWAANAEALREVGVTQIEVSGVCTATRTDDFFSHRGEQGQTGRFGALIGLQ